MSREKRYGVVGSLEKHFELVQTQLLIQKETNRRRQLSFAGIYFCMVTDDYNGSDMDFLTHPVSLGNEIRCWVDYINVGMPNKYFQYRDNPITIDGKLLNNQDDIAKQMGELEKDIIEKKIGPFTAWLTFMMIYPYLRGNELVGHLLWASMVRRESGKWPMQLPPKVYK